MYHYGRLRLLFNVLVLVLSVSLTLFIVSMSVQSYLIILTYLASTLVSFVCLLCLKLVLLGVLSFNVGKGSDYGSGGSGRYTTLWFILIMLIFAMPLIIVFLIPYLWLIILNGMAAGASISDLALYFRKRI